ncbi:ionotropic receptor 25a-like [Haliotis rubra]|uniref:ionotropic receptor 25a-like n=1 Tax=Haliotis rubra TaxID=36100 RepID=UPI001EE629E3|nr:ionotropic receptor 25a-like [Haliotis rubra]
MATFTMATLVLVVVVVVILPHGTGAENVPPTIVVILDEIIEKQNDKIPDILDRFNRQDNPSVTFQLVNSQNNDSLGTLDKVCDRVRDGVVGIIDITSPSVAPLMRSFASTLGIAYTSIVDSSYYRYSSGDSSIHFEVEPTSVELLRVVAAIVRKENLNNVAIVYDESFDIQNTPRRVLTNVPAQHLYVRQTSDQEETKRQLKMLQDIEIKNIFIISNVDNAEKFLGSADKLANSNFDVNWFVLTKDYTLVCGECQKAIVVNEIVASSDYPADSAYYEQFMDSNRASMKVDEALVYDIGMITKKAVSMFRDLRPITYSDCYNVSEPNVTDLAQSQNLTQALKEISWNGVYGALSLQQGILRYNFSLKINRIEFDGGDDNNKNMVGNWTEQTGLSLSVASLTTSSTKRHYRVVTVPGMHPFVYKEGGENGTEPKYSGYCIELLDKIADRMSFTYEIYDSPDGLVGSMASDGSWSGLINELIQKRAEIAVGPISVMAERENVVDFTVPYYDLVGLTILMKKPSFDYSLVKFLSVLDEDVWGCIIGAFFLFSILICVFDKLSPFSYQNSKQEWNGDGPEPRVFSLKEGIWFCMMSLTPQGGGETPRALSGRLIAATWWLFGFIIIATYTANLAAFLTVSRLETPIESLDDLSKQFKVKYAPMNGSNAQIYFQRMADIENKFYGIWKDMSLDDNLDVVSRAKLAVWDYPVSDKYTKLWETMKTSLFPSNKHEAVKRVLTGEFAFIADATVNKYSTLTDCDLWEVGEEFSRKPYALAVQEGSPLRSQLSNIILQLINQRELEEMKTKWWRKDQKECPKIENESDGISIKNIGGVFLVIVIGSGLALITLALECYWYKYKPKQKKKLYNINSQTNLTKNTVSSVTLPNGIENGGFETTFESMFDKEKKEEENRVNGTIDKGKNEKEDGYISGGFLEMVERL